MLHPRHRPGCTRPLLNPLNPQVRLKHQFRLECRPQQTDRPQGHRPGFLPNQRWRGSRPETQTGYHRIAVLWESETGQILWLRIFTVVSLYSLWAVQPSVVPGLYHGSPPYYLEVSPMLNLQAGVRPPLLFDLCGMGGATKSLHCRQHSSLDHCCAQTSTLRNGGSP
jgi:hypothetical protein